VQGGDRVRLAEAQAPQGGRLQLVCRVVDLVRCEDHRLAGLAEQPDHALVGGRWADPCVHDEDDHVREVDGDLRLLGDPRVKA